MPMLNKSYWFYLESYVYVSVMGENLLLYNTLTGKFLAYYDSPQLVEFIGRLRDKKNLYALEVTGEYLRANGLESFINDTRGQFMGDLVDVSAARKKPFLMQPYFDFRETVGEQPPWTFKNAGADCLFMLNQLTLYVTGRCENNCPHCLSAFKQFPWCTAREGGGLSLAEIESILEQLKGTPVKNVDILGGDLVLWPHLDRLVEMLGTGSFKSNYYFHLSHLKHLKNGLPESIRAARPKATVNVLVDCAALSNPHAVNQLKKLEADMSIFLIEREEEIVQLENVLERLGPGNVSVQPYFNGQNLDFFKENVFTDVESLEENILDIDMIKARNTRNSLYHGKLAVMTDHHIYSNVCGAPLGKIPGISIMQAVMSELKEHGNWMRVRRGTAPCCYCLLNSICPPLSNFEWVSGINNSCHIRKDSPGPRTNCKPMKGIHDEDHQEHY